MKAHALTANSRPDVARSRYFVFPAMTHQHKVQIQPLVVVFSTHSQFKRRTQGLLNRSSLDKPLVRPVGFLDIEHFVDNDIAIVPLATHHVDDVEKTLLVHSGNY